MSGRSPRTLPWKTRCCSPGAAWRTSRLLPAQREEVLLQVGGQVACVDERHFAVLARDALGGRERVLVAVADELLDADGLFAGAREVVRGVVGIEVNAVEVVFDGVPNRLFERPRSRPRDRL